jgi:hypothetical protein
MDFVFVAHPHLEISGDEGREGGVFPAQSCQWEYRLSIRAWLLLTSVTRPHALHSSISIAGKSTRVIVRANRIVSPQHGQAT